MPSAPFVLADHTRRGRARLGVKAGSSAVGIGLGTTLTTLGLVGAIVGGVVSFSSLSSDKTLPLIGAAVGLGSLVTGLVLLLVNATIVTFNE